VFGASKEETLEGGKCDWYKNLYTEEVCDERENTLPSILFNIETGIRQNKLLGFYGDACHDCWKKSPLLESLHKYFGEVSKRNKVDLSPVAPSRNEESAWWYNYQLEDDTLSKFV
jgi:hypothetical protein